VGRHSAVRSERALDLPDFPPAVSAATLSPTRITRAQTRAAARRRPIWLRSPVLPSLVVVLTLWATGDAYHLLAGQNAGAAQKTAADVQVDLSALASGRQALGPDGGSRRVSRAARNTVARPLTTATLPARPALPKVEPGRTVMGTWVRPSAGGESSCFCERWGVFHDGIDLAGPLGSAIVAAGDGVVVEAGPSDGFGHWIVIRHANGDVSVYGHMYTVLVAAGEHVSAGQHIADIGSDGQSTGPHLHFGIRQGGMTGPYIDPVPWLRARGVDVGGYDPNA
jgi:murein DD-endopeptidase MepM/ murein hydrolase activator NlpD